MKFTFFKKKNQSKKRLKIPYKIKFRTLPKKIPFSRSVGHTKKQIYRLSCPKAFILKYFTF